MLTVIETPLFQKLWPRYWTEEERGEFAAYLAAHPNDGAAVPGSGGVRKVRWARPGVGKSSGVRVIYFNRNEQGEIYLLTIYAKSETANLSAAILREIRNALES